MTDYKLVDSSGTVIWDLGNFSETPFVEAQNLGVVYDRNYYVGNSILIRTNEQKAKETINGTVYFKTSNPETTFLNFKSKIAYGTKIYLKATRGTVVRQCLVDISVTDRGDYLTEHVFSAKVSMTKLTNWLQTSSVKITPQSNVNAKNNSGVAKIVFSFSGVYSFPELPLPFVLFTGAQAGSTADVKYVQIDILNSSGVSLKTLRIGNTALYDAYVDTSENAEYSVYTLGQDDGKIDISSSVLGLYPEYSDPVTDMKLPVSVATGSGSMVVSAVCNSTTADVAFGSDAYVSIVPEYLSV
jgi:hypothetical protein